MLLICGSTSININVLVKCNVHMHVIKQKYDIGTPGVLHAYTKKKVKHPLIYFTISSSLSYHLCSVLFVITCGRLVIARISLTAHVLVSSEEILSRVTYILFI